MEFVLQFVKILFGVLQIAIVGRVLISWFRVHPSGPLYRFIYDISQPILTPIQRIMPRTGMLDFTPLIALIGLDVLESVIVRLLMSMP